MILVIIFLLFHKVDGESFHGNRGHGVQRVRVFEAPGLDVIKNDDFKPPELSEWNHQDPELQRRLIVFGSGSNKISMQSLEASEVGSMTTEVCRKCMVAGNIQCVSQLCMVQTSIAEIPKQINVQHKAFATGAALHGDILCSLCKQAHDVTCATRLCANPERDKIARDSGVECMQGFCRWQKETVINTGFQNYYSAWWQPHSLYIWFDQVTRELADAYKDFYSATSKAVNVLGR